MSPAGRGRPPKPLDPDTSNAAWLGAELRARRQAQGLTLTALAGLIGFSAQHISAVELATAPASRPFVTACDDALDAKGKLLALLPAVVWERATARGARDAARRRADPGAAHQALRWTGQDEAGADVDPLSRRSLLGVGVGAAVGLGATTAPAAAREIDPGLVAHWMTLLRLLDRHDAMFGPHDVLVTVRREVELIAAHRELARGGLRGELLRVEARWSEYASWLSSDAGDVRDCDAWAVRCLRAAKEAQDGDLVAWVLMWRSVWACERSDPRRALAFARAALRTPGVTDRIRALCAEQEAYAHALAGHADACRRSLENARSLLANGDPAPPWGDLGAQNVAPHFNLVGEARCWMPLQPRNAIALFEDALRQWPHDRPRSRGVQQVRLALACAATDEPDRAAAEGVKALNILRATRSDAIARKLKRLDHQLAAVDTAAATEFREAFAAL